MNSKMRELSNSWMYKLMEANGESVGVEIDLPPGFSSDDIEDAPIANALSNGEDISDVEISAEEQAIKEAIDDASIMDVPDEEMEDLKHAMIAWQNLDSKEKGAVKKAVAGKKIEDIADPKLKVFAQILSGDLSTRKAKIMHPSAFRDTGTAEGSEITLDEFRQLITKRPKTLIGQNKKLASSGSTTNQVFYDCTLPSYQGLFVDEATGQFKIVKTCPSAGMCTAFCYASKGGYIQQKGSSIKSSQTVNYLMNDYDGFRAQLLSELNRAIATQAKSGKTVVLRWHDSGDFLSQKYLMMAYEIAEATPDVVHYAYTKQLPLVRQNRPPENFEFVFSVGGLHDDTILKSDEKHSVVVPKTLFYDLQPPRAKGERTDKKAIATAKIMPEKESELKARVAEKYGIDLKTVLTYPELIKKPIGNERKWNVLVWSRHGDDAAARRDVLGVYLLFH